MQLRDYQIEVLDHLRTSLKQGAKAPLLVLPTGAGKTVIFSELAKECPNPCSQKRACEASL
jgi:superfamily II DNA or RNA helicase